MQDQAVKSLRALGQSPWLDFIARGFIQDGSLARLVARDGVGGVTSNPAIFQQALADGAEYEADFSALAAGGARGVGDIYETIAVADIQQAADVLRTVYDATGGLDGFVSLEVSPYLARDEAATVAEARHLWARVGRPNLMVKVPGTPECVPAIRTLIADGININVTLLFAQDAYQAVAEAYLAGLEDRLASGRPVCGVASVASFFVSRIDTAMDAEIDRRIAANDPQAAALRLLRGRVAIANAKSAYAWYQDLCRTARWRQLAAAGAAPQRLLWASTGTKDPAYRDVRYVEELVGADTVNTMPPATLNAFRDHGVARHALTENINEARYVLAETARLGLDLPGVAARLVNAGVRQFADAFDQLLGAVAARRTQVLSGRQASVRQDFSATLNNAVTGSLEAWRASGKVRALWAGDEHLWPGGSAGKRLGWLTIIEDGLAHLAELETFRADVAEAGFKHVLLLGMGGSSLGPEVLGRVLPRAPCGAELLVLDSTDPHQIATFASRVDLANTLVIVSSKSGTTLEPNILQACFLDRMRAAVGDRAADHFVAVTDPGSALAAFAAQARYRRIFLGDPTIGGRFSVLSNFGLVPAAAAGLDVAALLQSAARMVQACAPLVPPAQNPGVRLGAAMAAAHAAGRDKLTILASPALAPAGAWLEQLIAESTGKGGVAIIPIVGETPAAADSYGADRYFVRLALEGAGEPAIDDAVGALIAAGHPVTTLTLGAAGDIGQLFFVFEFATAVAGSLMRIDPFDQPDVEASKLETRALTDVYSNNGALPAETAFATFGALRLFADAKNTAAIGAPSLPATLRAHFDRIAPGDYAAILAYVEQNEIHTTALSALRDMIRARYRVATTLQFGPRFLHSTGQAFKGGPNSGVFLQITADDAADLAVPGEVYTFGVVKAAQARGDFAVLASRGRRALRVHITGDLAAGLDDLREAISTAFAGALEPV